VAVVVVVVNTTTTILQTLRCSTLGCVVHLVWGSEAQFNTSCSAGRTCSSTKFLTRRCRSCARADKLATPNGSSVTSRDHDDVTELEGEEDEAIFQPISAICSAAGPAASALGELA